MVQPASPSPSPAPSTRLAQQLPLVSGSASSDPAGRGLFWRGRSPGSWPGGWLARRGLAATIDLACVVLSAAVPYGLGAIARESASQGFGERVPLAAVVATVDGAIAWGLDQPPRPSRRTVPPLTNLLWTGATVAPILVLAIQWWGLARSGQTLAKARLGLRVVSVGSGSGDRRPGFFAIARREGLGRWGLPLGLAYSAWRLGGAMPDGGLLLGLALLLMAAESIAALADSGRSLHDRWAGTRVLDLWAEPLTEFQTEPRLGSIGVADGDRSEPQAGPNLYPLDPSHPLAFGYASDRQDLPGSIASPSTNGATRLGPRATGLWYWLREHPGASLVTAVTAGTLLILTTFIGTQIYAQQEQTARIHRQQDRELLLGLVGKYSHNAPDERRGSVLAIASLNDPNPELLLLVNLLGQEDDPQLIESLQQAITSRGTIGLTYLARLNQMLRADLEGKTNSNPTDRQQAALRLQASQRAIAKLLSLRDPKLQQAADASTYPVDLQRVYLGQITTTIAPFQLVLERADLAGIDWRGAILTGASLLGSQFHNVGPDGRLGTADDAIANLAGAELSGTDLSYANLNGVDLSQASLLRSSLSYAKLIGASLENSNLSGAKLVRTWFTNANLDRASLTAADLTEADLRQASLSEAKLGQVKASGSRFDRANLSRASLRAADLAASNFQGADLKQADLSGSKLGNTNLQGARLEEANLQGSDLNRADLRSSHLDGANLQGASLTSTLPAADVNGANGVNRPNSIAPETSGAIVKGADFSLVKNLDPRQLAYLCANGAIHPKCTN